MRLALTGVPESRAVPDDDPAPGSVTEYTDVLYDHAGTRVGTTTGRAVVLGTTPRPRRLHRTLIELPDGAIESLDVRLDGTVTATVPVTGVSGRYIGRTGYHTLGPGTCSRYALTIVFGQSAG